MRRFALILIALIMMAVPAAATDYSIDFSNYSNFNSTWAVTDTGTKNVVITSEYLSIPTTLLDGAVYNQTMFTLPINISFKLVDDNAGSGAYSVMFGLQNTSTNGDGYYIKLYDQAAGGGSMRLVDNSNASNTIDDTVTGGDSGLYANDTTIVKYEINSTYTKIFFNDTFRGEFLYPELTYQSGYVGVRGIGSTQKSAYDNFSIITKHIQVLDNDENIFWVRPDGNDTSTGQNNMSYEANATDCAWKTIKYALSQIEAGDTVKIQNGTYISEYAEITHEGTSESPITIIGYDNPIMVNENATDSAIRITKSYVDISEISIDGYAGYSGIYIVPASGTTIKNHTISNISVNGSLNGVWARADIGGSQIHNLTIVNNSFENMGSATGAGAIRFGGIETFEIESNTMKNCGKSAVIGEAFVHNGSIRYNNASNLGGHAIILGATTNKNVDISYNFIEYSSQRGIRIDSYGSDFTILHNTIQNCVDWAIQLYGSITNATISDNICTNNTYIGCNGNDAGIDGDNVGLVIRNNTLSGTYIYLNMDTGSTCEGAIIENNTVSDTLGVHLRRANGTIIRNNIIKNISTDGILAGYDIAGAQVGNTSVYNNVFHNISGSAIENRINSDIIDIRNNIFDTITSYTIYNNSGGIVSSSYNCYYNNSTSNWNGYVNDGTGDVFANPLFYDIVKDNFHLNSTVGTWNGTDWEIMNTDSPCIDAGDPTSDYSLEPYPYGTAINIGAYGNTDEASKSIVYAPSISNLANATNTTTSQDISATSNQSAVNWTVPVWITGQVPVYFYQNGTQNLSITIPGLIPGQEYNYNVTAAHQYDELANSTTDNYNFTTQNTIYVNETGWYVSGGIFHPSAEPMQPAINNATSGNIIRVWNGTYNITEHVGIYIDNLTIIGEGQDVVHVNSSNWMVFYIYANQTSLSGFNISNDDGNSLYIENVNDCTIFNNTIHNDAYGIWIYASDNISVYNNTIYDMSEYCIYIANATGGFGTRESENIILTNNTLSGDGTSNNDYVFYGTINPTVTDNINKSNYYYFYTNVFSANFVNTSSGVNYTVLHPASESAMRDNAHKDSEILNIEVVSGEFTGINITSGMIDGVYYILLNSSDSVIEYGKAINNGYNFTSTIDTGIYYIMDSGNIPEINYVANESVSTTSQNISATSNQTVDWITRIWKTGEAPTIYYDNETSVLSRIAVGLSENTFYNFNITATHLYNPLFNNTTANYNFTTTSNVTNVSGVWYFHDYSNIPELYTAVNNESVLGFNGTAYFMNESFYQNKSTDDFNFSETVYLKSNDDGNPIYYRWAGNTTFNNASIFGWDTVNQNFAEVTDSTRSAVYSDVDATGDITNCNFSYLGYNAADMQGLNLNAYTGQNITNYNSVGSFRGIYFYINCDNNTLTDVTCDSVSASIFITSGSDNNVFTNCTGTSGTSEGIYVLSSRNNVLTNCTGTSDSDYGFAISGESDNTTLNSCTGISNSKTGMYIDLSNDTIATNCIAISGSEIGTAIIDCDNVALINHISNGTEFNYSIEEGSINTTIINPANSNFTVNMTDVVSQLYIKNTDGQLFNETATAQAYSYANGTFQMYETGTAENFTVTLYNYFLTASETSNTIANVPGTGEYGNITVNDGVLDTVIVSGLTPATTYYLYSNISNVTIQSVDSDGDGNATFTANLSSGTYRIFDTGLSTIPTVNFVSQTPATLQQNSTGSLQLIYEIIPAPGTTINESDVIFQFRTCSALPVDCNHSIRYSGDWWIYRGQNRNNTGIYRLAQEDNVSIWGEGYANWSGMDEDNIHFNITQVNDTYWLMSINASVQDLVNPQSWPIDRTDLQEANKTLYPIYKQHHVIFKYKDLEALRGSTDYITSFFINTGLQGLNPIKPVVIVYATDSFDPEGAVDIADSPYAFVIDTSNFTVWNTHSYSPRTNATYHRYNLDMTAVINAGIIPTDDAYLCIITDAAQTRPYSINITDANSSMNTSFSDANLMWTGSGAPYSQYPYTPDIFESFLSDNMVFTTKAWAANNLSAFGNSTLHQVLIDVSVFGPTTPMVDHIHYDGTEYAQDDINNSNFNGTIGIGVAVANDPDGGVVTHNLTLHKDDGTFVATINNTFLNTDVSHDSIYADISFNTIPYYNLTQLYTLKVVATDDEGNTSYSWLIYNFTLFHNTDAPTNLLNATGNFYVNYTWTGTADADAYNISFNDTWFNGTDNYINQSVGPHGWGNISVYQWNSSTGISSGYLNDTVQVPNNAPVLSGCPDSNTNEDIDIIGAFDLDDYFTDADGDTPIFSVLSNNATGNCDPTINGDNTVDYDVAADWHGIAGIVYNASDGYGGNDSDAVRVIVSSVNDAPVLDAIGAQNVNEGETITIDVDATDGEGDPLTYGCNRTDLFIDFNVAGGFTEWVTNFSSAGVYYVLFNVTDGTDTDSEIVTITVTDVPLTTDSYWNNVTGSSLAITIDVNDTIEFGVVISRISNVSWYTESGLDETDVNTTTANYTLLFGTEGTYYVNSSAINESDYSNTTFTITVNPVLFNISGYVYDKGTGIGLNGVIITNNVTADTTTTNALGYYLLSGLANGSYEITASKSGYETNSTTTTITGSNVEDVNILLTWIEPSSTSYIPYQIFILLVIVMITTTGYSFNTEDKSYYTDIITSLLSCLLSLLLAYYSFIGIGFNYALSASVEHEAYTLIPLGILFVCIAVIMLIFFIIKILELGHQELEEL